MDVMFFACFTACQGRLATVEKRQQTLGREEITPNRVESSRFFSEGVFFWKQEESGFTFLQESPHGFLLVAALPGTVMHFQECVLGWNSEILNNAVN